MTYPAEISISGIFFPPLLFALILSALITFVIAKLMFKYKLLRFIWHPPLFFLALWCISTGFVSVFIIPT